MIVKAKSRKDRRCKRPTSPSDATGDHPIRLRLFRSGYDMYERLADSPPFKLECDQCGKKRTLSLTACMRSGWIKCCGKNMMLWALTPW